MKRKEIEGVIELNRRKRTATLNGYIGEMSDIIQERDRSKSMWFWRDNGNASQRAWKADRYYYDTTIEMTGVTIKYHRSISMSRKNTYVYETLKGFKDGDEIKITVTDLRKFIEGYTAIVNKRLGKDLGKEKGDRHDSD